MTGNKLQSLANKWLGSITSDGNYDKDDFGFIAGFKKAFEIIDENLAVELVKLAEFQPHGERLMTLKLYKAKIAGILKEMEQEYE